MAFNYANLTDNMLPLFGTMPNGVSLPNHPTFLNQLAAALNSATAVCVTSTTSTSTPTTAAITTPNALLTANAKIDTTAIVQKLNAQPKMKPNQGTAPMDLENDSENETTPTIMTTTVKPAEKLTQLSLPDTNMYLNSLMPTTGYMFFPTAANAPASTATATTTSGATAPVLMDHSAMMAAAMQQMQQNYASYATLSEPTAVVDGNAVATATDAFNAATTNNGSTATTTMKEVIKTKNCILFPPNPNAPPPTIRERPPGCRTVFVGGLPENITEDIIREIFESCGEITTLRMSKKNFCHIRYRHEASIDRAIYLSGYRVRISNVNEPPNFGRLHVDYAQARDDQYDYECKQRQLQREARHRERMSLDRIRSQSPPPMPHYTEHEASVVAENLRNNDTFLKAIQTITVWLERGDCSKRNANIFYSMMQSTHSHVRRLHADKQQLEDDLRKARENYRKQMFTISTQFTQIEKVFNAASHKKVWDHFTKAQRKNIDQWKKLVTELRTVHIDDDEMEISDDERDYSSRHTTKRTRYDSECLKDENDALRCQLEAIRNEISMERTDLRHDSVQREKQIKVLQETIRNLQTQLLQTKLREQKDAKTIEQLESRLKEAGIEYSQPIVINEICIEDDDIEEELMIAGEPKKSSEKTQEIIDIDGYKDDDDVHIIEHQSGLVEIHEIEDDEKQEAKPIQQVNNEVKQTLSDNNSTTSETVQKAKEIETLNISELQTSAVEKCDSKSLELNEAKIIALTAAYLVMHPQGVSVQHITAYLCELIKSIQLEFEYLEGILSKYTNLFKKAETKTVHNLTKWSFCGFIDSEQQLIECTETQLH